MRQKRTSAERIAGRVSPASIHARKPCGSRDQRRQGCGLPRQHRLGALHLALLIEIRLDDPLVQGERGFCLLEDVGAVDDAQGGVQAQPQAFDGCGEVPRLDQLPVGSGLATDELEPGAVEKSLGQGMAGERLVEPGDGGARRRARRRAPSGRALGPSEPGQRFDDDAVHSVHGCRFHAGGPSTGRGRVGRATRRDSI